MITENYIGSINEQISYNEGKIYNSGRGYTSELIKRLYDNGYRASTSGIMHYLYDNEGRKVLTAYTWIALLKQTAILFR